MPFSFFLISRTMLFKFFKRDIYKGLSEDNIYNRAYLEAELSVCFLFNYNNYSPFELKNSLYLLIFLCWQHWKKKIGVKMLENG